MSESCLPIATGCWPWISVGHGIFVVIYWAFVSTSSALFERGPELRVSPAVRSRLVRPIIVSLLPVLILFELWPDEFSRPLLLGSTGACSVLAGAGMLVVLYFFSCLEVSSWHLKSTLLNGSYRPLFACGCPRGLLSLIRPLDDDDIQIHMH